MSTITEPITKDVAESRHTPREQTPSISGPRLPYHPAIEERFGIDRASWKALCEAIYPNATSTESIILALSYCRARKLDPFKRNVHIVPIWNREINGYIDTIWPGIGELRTTAFRTKEYAGRGETVYGPDVEKKVGSKPMVFPEWAQVTVRRMICGQIVDFSGPRVYWLETYASKSHKDDTPNDMWETRPRGQIDKCAEAAALRAAFPEEIGTDYIAEEVEHRKTIDGTSSPAMHIASLDDLTARVTATRNTEPVATRETEPAQTVETPKSEPKADEPVTTEKPSGLTGVKEMMCAVVDSLRDITAIANGVREQRTLTTQDELLLDEMVESHHERIRSARGTNSNKSQQQELGDAHEG